MSAPTPDELQEGERWRTEAHEELLIAQRLAADPDLPPRAACFHAHVAAEKAIKALMIRHGITVPRVHHLRRLADTLPGEPRGRLRDTDLDRLNPWTIDGRYPADLVQADPSVVPDVLAAGERVIEAADRDFS